MKNATAAPTQADGLNSLRLIHLRAERSAAEGVWR